MAVSRGFPTAKRRRGQSSKSCEKPNKTVAGTTHSKLLGTRNNSLRLLPILPQQLAQFLHLREQDIEIHLMPRIHRQGHIHPIHAIHAGPIDLRVDLMLRDRQRRLPRQGGEVGGAGRVVEEVREHVRVGDGHFVELDQRFMGGGNVMSRGAVEGRAVVASK